MEKNLIQNDSMQNDSDKIFIDCIYYSFYISKKELQKYNLSETDKNQIIKQNYLHKLNKHRYVKDHIIDIYDIDCNRAINMCNLFFNTFLYKIIKKVSIVILVIIRKIYIYQ